MIYSNCKNCWVMMIILANQISIMRTARMISIFDLAMAASFFFGYYPIIWKKDCLLENRQTPFQWIPIYHDSMPLSCSLRAVHFIHFFLLLVVNWTGCSCSYFLFWFVFWLIFELYVEEFTKNWPEWSELTWTDLNWPEMTWIHLKWLELTWADLYWPEMTWADLNWSELNWAVLNRPELTWDDLNWPELNWADLNWPEMTWADLNWPELT